MNKYENINEFSFRRNSGETGTGGNLPGYEFWPGCAEEGNQGRRLKRGDVEGGPRVPGDRQAVENRRLSRVGSAGDGKRRGGESEHRQRQSGVDPAGFRRGQEVEICAIHQRGQGGQG